MNKKRALAIGGAAAVTLLMAVPAFAATTGSIPYPNHFGRGNHKFSGVIGIVSNINGTTLTVTGKNGITYSVDVSDATFNKGFGKNTTSISLSNIAVNDTVIVQGTVNGSSVTATTVEDGVPTRPAGQGTGHGMGRGMGMHGNMTNVSFGTIASINGSTFTINERTQNGTTTPTITTTSATTFKKNGQADTSSDLAVGQMVVVMGTKDSAGNVADATSVNIMVRRPRTNTSS